MTDRATLAGLAKLVAADVAAGQPGANTWMATQALEQHPEAVQDFIEMAVAERRKKRPNDKLTSAYAYLIGYALEIIRRSVEQGNAGATSLAETVRKTLL